MAHAQRCLVPRFALTLTLLLVLTPFARAELAASGQGLRIEPASLSWDLGAAPHDGARLVVSGPDGFYLARSFAAGEPPALSLFDEAGQPLPDGTYAWELATAPAVDPELREALRESRKAGLAPRATGLPLPRGERSSGYFAVYGSRFVVPSSAEASEAPLAASGPAAGQEIAERATVIDELCVGLGCTTTLTYSDSNAVLRDTDTRLKFADTSASSPFFSSSDWEIEINSADGGAAANYFGLNDCGYSSGEGGCASDLVFAVEAGARQHALYVEDDGQVGIGTSSPQRELHLVSADSPAIRLDQDGTGAFGPYDWDLAGNEENFFLRDVTNNNTVPFRVDAGADADTLVVGVDGEVAINGATPTYSDHLTVNVKASNGGIAIESATNFPQLTFIEGNDIWRWRAANEDFVLVNVPDGGSGLTPIRVYKGADTNLLVIGGTSAAAEDSDRVTVNGELFINSSQVTPDYVFDPGYRLESIDEHASYMFEKRHLPAVGAAEIGEDGRYAINVGRRNEGMLEELEKAHIYIARLHEAAREKDRRIAELEGRLAGFSERMAAVEAALDER